MRYLVLVAACCTVVGCAGKPPQRTAEESEKTIAALVPERVKGPFKVVMRGDEKLYCTKELATGSHVNFRTICLTNEEYDDLEARARSLRDGIQSGPISPSGPSGTGPGQNPMMPGT